MDLPLGLSRLPSPQSAVATLTAFLRGRFSDVGGTLAPLLARLDAAAADGDETVRTAAHNLATVIVTAAGPFAPTSYARARLLRQMHASGLLSRQEAEQTVDLLGIAG